MEMVFALAVISTSKMLLKPTTLFYIMEQQVNKTQEQTFNLCTLGQVYNIGTQKEQTILQVAEAICKGFGLGHDRIVHVADRAFNDRRYFICDQKLAALGWKEKTSFEDGLKKTIQWYLENGRKSFWDNGDADAALEAHPTLTSVGYKTVQ